MDTPSMDKMAEVYIKIRNKKQELTKAYDAEVALLDGKLKMIAGVMKDQLVAAGGSALKTPHGTVYMTKKVRYYPMDWSAFGEWIVTNNAIDLLEKRVAQGNMAKWMEESPTNPPPGLQAEAEMTVTVRKN